METNYDYISNTIVVKFDRAKQPKYVEKNGTYKYVEYGEDNKYPNYLIDLFNESPKHGAIVKGKANYIFGKGFQDVPKKANQFGQSWNSILKKAILDDELQGGYYLQITYNALGDIASVYNIDFHKVRSNADGSKFFVKDNWDDNREKPRIYDGFNPTQSGRDSQILFVKQYSPNSEVYPKPSYFQALNYIESDIQISRHILGNAKQGFVGSTLINLNNGEPQEEQKAEVERGLKKKLTGSEGDRIVIMFNKSNETAASIVPLGQTMLTKEDFTNVNNLVQQEIFAGHQITSPSLFGIKTEGQLGGRNEIKDAYEIFNNTYVNERQQAHEEVFNRLMNLAGIPGEYTISTVEPLGFELKEDLLLQVLPREYFLDKLSVEEKYYQLDPVSGPAHLPTDATGTAPAPTSVPNQPVQNTANNILTNLSGRQSQNVMRIVRQFSTGKLTKDQAAFMLKSGFGFSDDDVNTFLGIDDDATTDFADEWKKSDEALIFEFSQCGENISDYELMEARPLMAFEQFAEDKKLSELESNILNLISKDSKINSATISDVLKIDVKVVDESLKGLEDSGLIKKKVDSKGITTTQITKPLSEIQKEKPTVAKVLLRYRYAWRKDISANEKASGRKASRDFCKMMMSLADSGRIYSRSDIENISLRLGYSVFDRVGGWWTREDGTHSPQCRHTWEVLTVTKKV